MDNGCAPYHSAIPLILLTFGVLFRADSGKTNMAYIQLHTCLQTHTHVRNETSHEIRRRRQGTTGHKDIWDDFTRSQELPFLKCHWGVTASSDK